MLYLDAFSTAWQEWVINYDWVHQLQLAHQVQTHVEIHAEQAKAYLGDFPDQMQARLQSWLPRVKTQWRQHGRMAGLALAAALLLIWMRWRWGAWRWTWLRRRRDPALLRAWNMHQASLAWQRLQRLLRRAGYVRKASETPEEFAARLAPGPLREAVCAFIEQYELARFGNRLQDLEVLHQNYDQVRRSLRVRPATTG